MQSSVGVVKLISSAERTDAMISLPRYAAAALLAVLTTACSHNSSTTPFGAAPFSNSSQSVVMQRVPPDRDSAATPLVRAEFGMALLSGDTVLLSQQWTPVGVVRPHGSGGGDSLIIVRRGLRPVYERLEARGAVRTFNYAGTRVTGTIESPDSAPRQFDTTFAELPFAFNEADLLVRSVPFTDGYSIVVPFFSELDEAIERDTIAVLGSSQVNGRDAWQVRFSDPAIVADYAIAADTREILSHHLVQRKTGTRLEFVPDQS